MSDITAMRVEVDSIIIKASDWEKWRKYLSDANEKNKHQAETIAERDAEYSFALRNNRELDAKNIDLERQNRELQEAIAVQILTHPKEKIEIKFSDEAQAKAMIKIVKENRELRLNHSGLIKSVLQFIRNMDECTTSEDYAGFEVGAEYVQELEEFTMKLDKALADDKAVHTGTIAHHRLACPALEGGICNCGLDKALQESGNE